MLLPLLLRFLESRLPLQVDGLNLVLFKQLGDDCIHEHQLPHNVGDVDLHGDLLAALGVSVGGLPVRLFAKVAQEGPEDHAEVEEDVEGPRVDLLALVVDHQLPAQADLVGLLGVELHDKDESQNGADESSDIGKICINLVESSLVGHLHRGFPDIDLNKIGVDIGHKG